MKRIIEKPDYRSMDEARLKHELVGLERRILGITGDPLGYRHYRRFLDWSRNEAKVKEIEELMLDRCIILNLLFDCHCTPAEVERLEKVNDLLLEMTNRTYHRTADLVRALLVMKKDDMETGPPGPKGLCVIPGWNISLSVMLYMRYVRT